MYAVGRPVFIRSGRDELLDRRDFAALHAIELANLYEMRAPQLLGTLLAFHRRQTVFVVVPAHDCNERRFTYALRPRKYQTVVILTPRRHDAGDSRGEVYSSDRAVELGVFGPYIVYYHAFEATDAIPFQRLEILAYRVPTVPRNDHVKCVSDLILARYVVVPFEPSPQIGVVSIAPGFCFGVPGQAAFDGYIVSQHIEIYMPAQAGGVLDD